MVAGLSPLTALQQLTHLDLAYTNITDSGVHSLKHLTNLLDLNLDSCNITDRCTSCLVIQILNFAAIEMGPSKSIGFVV